MKRQLLFLRVLAFIFLIMAISNYRQYEKLIVDDQKDEFQILSKKCRNSRRPSYITIKTPKGDFESTIRRTSCFKLDVGDEITLYFNTSYTKFYELDNDGPFRELIAGCVFFIFLFMPWGRIKKKK